MIFHHIKTKGIKKKFKELEMIMNSIGFIRWAWDYEKAVYDYKYTINGVDYYLRLHGKVINNYQLENPKAVLELNTPIFVRHYFPHGLDDSVEVPTELQKKVEEKLTELKRDLSCS
jgi:hypothetical protein